MTNLKNIMTAAWTMAREGQAKFGGSVRQYLAAALKSAWAAASKKIDRKMIARALDRAAARTDSLGGVGATPKQCWFLAGLMADANDDGVPSMLSKREASALIDQFLKAA